MKVLSLIAVFAGASLVASQDLSKLPQCALNCASPWITDKSKTGCSQGDIKCYCQNQQFIDSVSQCIRSTCPASDVQNASGFASTLCSQAGVTVNTNAGLPSSTSATSATQTEAPTASATTTTTNNVYNSTNTHSAKGTAPTAATTATTTGAANALAISGLSIVAGALAAIGFL